MRALRWILLILFGFLLFLPSRALLLNESLPKTRPLTNRTFERTEKRLARGKYLAEGVLQCFVCHSERDWKQAGAPPIPSTKGGGSILISEKDYLLAAPNITPDKQTGAGTWTDDMLARSIREGVGHDGRALAPLMWYQSFRMLPDEDLASVVVYLRSIPPVHLAQPKRSVTPEKEKQFAHGPEPITKPVPTPDLSTPLLRGRFLARISDCAGCHTAWYGDFNPGYFGGGNFIERGEHKAFSTNLTSDPSGIPYYDANLFLEVIRTGKVKARELSPLMPWIVFRNMSDEDLTALFTFLKDLKPVRHSVANGEKPTLCKLCGQSHGHGEYNKVWAPVAVSVSPTLLASYAGKYEFADGFQVSLVMDKDKLCFLEGDGSKTELIPISRNEFVTRKLGSPFTFVTDAKGKVTELHENSAFDPARRLP